MGRHRARTEERVAVRRLLRDRTFRVLYAVEAQSIIGDQLARVALSVLVFRRTGSVPATAVTYAATFVPAVLGGFLLARLGDRWPRRAVMIGCDLVRAACFLLMLAVTPWLAGVGALVVLAVAVGPVFSAAQLGLLSTRMDADAFTTANALRLVTSQAAQILGFAFAGALVALLGPSGALAINAATFGISALLVAVGLPRQEDDARGGADPVTTSDPVDPEPARRPVVEHLWRDRRIRAAFALSLCIGFFVVPEGLAVPFGGQIGATVGQVGLLLAAGALGGAVGAAALMRVAPSRRDRVSRWGAIAAGLPLVVCAPVTWAGGDWWAAAVCWALSGVCAAYVVHVSSTVILAVPERHRSEVVGVVGAVLLAVQGVGVVVFGAVGTLWSPAAAIGVAGALGAVGAAWFGRAAVSPATVGVAVSPAGPVPAGPPTNQTVTLRDQMTPSTT
ncbi:MFS transporter [Jatrophihabitans fulvus]